MAVIPLTAYHWAQNMATASEFAGSFQAIILLIYHSYFVWSVVKKQNKRSVSFIQFVSLFYLASLVPYCVGVLLLSFGVKTSLGCKYFTDVISTGLFMSKCMCFLVFVEKLNITFAGSVYAFNASTIKISKIILVLWTSILIAILYISGDGYYVPEHDICAGSYPLWAHAVAILGDFIIGLTISTTFCRRLIEFQIILQNVSPNVSDTTGIIKQTQGIKDLMNKFTTLATLSIFTTLFVYVLIFVFELGSFFMVPDTMINSWCIILLFEGNHKIYNFMCRPMEICCIASGLLSCCSCKCCCAVTPTVIKLEDDTNKDDVIDGTTNGIEITTKKSESPQSENADDTPKSIEIETEKS